jgi:hypothetical protein
MVIQVLPSLPPKLKGPAPNIEMLPRYNILKAPMNEVIVM